MNLSQMHYFQVVAEEEHISRAAEKLHVSQPSLSTTIRRLETELETPLFERRGRKLLNHVRYIFAQIEALDENMNVLSFNFANRFQLAVNNSMFLDNWLCHFIGDHRQARITQSLMSESQMLEALEAETIDVAMGDFSEFPASVSHHTLSDDEYVIAMPTTHPLADKPILQFEDIRSEPFVSLSSNRIRRIVDNLFAQKAAMPNIIFEGTKQMMFDVLMKKNCLLFASRQMLYMKTSLFCPTDLLDKRIELRLVPVADLESHYPFSICWKKNRELPVMADVFIQSLIDGYPKFTDDAAFCEKNTVQLIP